MYLTYIQEYKSNTVFAIQAGVQPASARHAAIPFIAWQRVISACCDVKLVSCVLHVLSCCWSDCSSRWSRLISVCDVKLYMDPKVNKGLNCWINHCYKKPSWP